MRCVLHVPRARNNCLAVHFQMNPNTPRLQTSINTRRSLSYLTVRTGPALTRLNTTPKIQSNPFTNWIAVNMETYSEREAKYEARMTRMQENCRRLKEDWNEPNKMEGYWKAVRCVKRVQTARARFPTTAGPAQGVRGGKHPRTTETTQNQKSIYHQNPNDAQH